MAIQEVLLNQLEQAQNAAHFSETFYCILVGLFMGLGIILGLAWYPGEPFDYSRLDGGVDTASARGGEGEECVIAGGQTRPVIEEEEEEPIVGEEARILPGVADVAAPPAAAAAAGANFPVAAAASLPAAASLMSPNEADAGEEQQEEDEGEEEEMVEVDRQEMIAEHEEGDDDADGQQQQQNEEVNQVADILADEERLMSSKGLDRAKKFFGLSDDQLRQAIRKTRADVLKTGDLSDACVEHGALSARADMIFYLLAFSALIYFINRDYGGLATRFFRTVFPKEAALLLGPDTDREL